MDSIYSIIPSTNSDHLIKFSSPSIAKVYFRNHSHDYLTDRKSDDNIHTLLKKIEHIKAGDYSKEHHIFHLYFELGYLLNDLAHLITDEMPLAIELVYLEQKVIKKKTNFVIPVLKLIESPSYSEYKKGFAKIKEYLLNGDFYQLNFTDRSIFLMDKFYRPDDFILSLFNHKNVGAYSHATFIGPDSKIILSNSPELLFKRNFKKENIEIYSTPIKGTQKLVISKKASWQKLKNSKKDEAELNMISDLLRNDLSRIDKPNGEILYKKKPLFVAGLVHQFSVVRAIISEKISVFKVLAAIFPGGSVTGAPKKKVLEKIHELELSPRGIYCGSTLIYSKHLLCANINIRTAEISLENRELILGTGGGITLLSECHEEYLEMIMKRDSFLRIFSSSSTEIKPLHIISKVK